jgi:hypothetical protein
MIASERNAAENSASPRKKAEVTIAGDDPTHGTARGPRAEGAIPSQKNAATTKKLVKAAKAGRKPLFNSCWSVGQGRRDPEAPNTPDHLLPGLRQ